MKLNNGIRGAFRLAATAVLAAALLPAQQGGQQGGGATAPPGGGGGATAPSIGTPSTPGGTTGRQQQQPFPQQQDRNQFPDMQRPIFLSGKVVMDDGTPPPEPVTIERVCNGRIRPEGYTDSKGRFSFQLGQNMGVMPDASISSGGADSGFGGGGFGGGGMNPTVGSGGQRGGVSERDLMGCELRASLAGFRSEMVNLTGRRMMDNPDVGTIILHRLAGVEGFTYSAISAMAPKDAKKAYDKGRDLAKKKKMPEAQKEFEKAVGIYPKFAQAWFDLGQIQESQQNVGEALKSYTQAVTADPKFVSPYMNIAGLYARDNKWQEVADSSAKAVKLNPFDFPRAYFLNAVANLNLQNLEQAEKSAREAKKLDTKKNIPQLDHVLGVILAQKQDFPGAAEFMRSYLAAAPDANNADTVKKQLAEIDKILAAGANAAQPAQQ